MLGHMEVFTRGHSIQVLKESPEVLGPTKEEFGGATSRAVVFHYFFFATKTVVELLKPLATSHGKSEQVAV